MSALVQSFAPLVTTRSRVLVLGSIPGIESLNAVQYYAHPRNAFWPIMAALFGFSAALPYTERCSTLLKSGVALWDSMRQCERPGSLDSAVVTATIEANDFVWLFEKYPRLQHVFCNGSKSEQVFRRHVLPTLSAPLPEVARLPSTSPAHASLSFTDKLAAWSVVREALGGQ